ncbi:MAG TPA: DUF1361 domain-containing protein [Candidatus Saccharimonadales bacterium]|nr:DUF1361 domain-containing protein [Candidatus Saccharimonadales bacterium]
MKQWRSPRAQYLLALGLASLVSLAFFAFGALRNHSLEFDYFIWNLFLAWLPLVFAVRLVVVLRRKAWTSWEGILWSALWLLFLPNSFYMITDFIHLQDVLRVDILYDTLMFTSFIYTGVALGFSSLYMIQTELAKRLPKRTVRTWLAAVLLICSSAIYLGRDLRWNSWDVLTNPGGLLFDVSDRLIHPTSYPQMLLDVIGFFVLLSAMYWLVLRCIDLLRLAPHD